MKTNVKRSLAWLLALALAVTCLVCLPAVSLAEGSPVVDGTKDAAYTDAKKLVISTAYAGAEQGATENTTQGVITAWYTWDDTTNYVYWEYDEPGFQNSGANQDTLYFINRADDLVQQFMLYAQGGGYYQVTLAGSSGSTLAATSAGSNTAPTASAGFVSEDNKTRRYEISFPRAADSEGFYVSPVLYVTGSYDIAYGSMYNTLDAKLVKYNDESTWAETVEPDGSEITDPNEPVPPPEVKEDGIDCVFDERYSDERVTEISKAYAGPGQGSIPNTLHIFSETYYAWDDANIYVYLVIHDPFMSQGLDVFYWVSNTASAGGNMFAVPGGGYMQFDTAQARVTGNMGAINSYALWYGNDRRVYEFSIPRSQDAIGFMFSSLAYRENGAFTVSYNTNYYICNTAKVVLFGANQDGHWTDHSTAVDPDVMNDPDRLAEIQALLATVPADVDAMTEADIPAVLAIRDEVESVGNTWSVFYDEDDYARYKAAVTKALELQAAQQADAIANVESLIEALPDEVFLSEEEQVNAAKEAFTALGELGQFVKADLQAKLNAAVARIQSLHAPVKLDGKKDPAYDAMDFVPIELHFPLGTSSDFDGISTETYGEIYTTADDNFAYFYVIVNDTTGIVDFPEDGEWINNLIYSYDSVTMYIDMDPTVRPTEAPYKDLDVNGDSIFTFTMLANGQVPTSYINSRNNFITDPAYFQPFRTETTYGFELKVPRIADEESFAYNAVISDPIWEDNGSGQMELSSEKSSMIAMGKEWAYFYASYAEMFYEDYPAFPTYADVIAMVESLPDPEAIDNHSYDKTIAAAREGLDYLNDDQAALVPQAVKDKLAAAEEKIATLPPDDPTPPDPPAPAIKLGDPNDDKAIDAKDALLVLKAAVGKATLTEDQTKAADVNGDNTIDAKDALEILKFAVNKIDHFSVENKQ